MSSHVDRVAEAERMVLGAVLVEPAKLGSVGSVLRPGHFADPRHRAVFSAMLALEVRGDSIDHITLQNQLGAAGNIDAAGGLPYLSKLLDGVPRITNPAAWARMVTDAALRRDIVARVERLRALATRDDISADELMTQGQAAFLDLAAPSDAETLGPADLLKLGGVALDELATAADGLTGVPTGIQGIDAQTGGLQPGQYIAIGARPSCGKTSLGLQIADHAAKQGIVAQVFSLEMSPKEMSLRRVCAEAEVAPRRIRGAGANCPHWPPLLAALERLGQTPLHIEEMTNPTAAQIWARAKRLQARFGLGLVVVDYIQYVRGEGRAENRNNELATISRTFKAMARSLAVPVVVLAQLNRLVEGRTEKRPLLSDFRDSGAIEADADVAMLIWRKGAAASDPRLQGETDLIIAKHRNGPTGSVPVWFNLELARFENLKEGRAREQEA